MLSHTRSSALVISMFALVASLFAAIASVPAEAVGEDSGGVFVPLTPTQIVSTSDGIGGSSTPFGEGTTRSYTVLGNAGVPTTGVSAVVANVSVLHATSDSASSHLVVWPSGETKPTAKTMYFEEDNSSRSNTTIVKVGSDGKISVYNNSGTVDISIAITGYFTTTSDETSPGGFVPITPTRVADTTTGQGVPLAKLPQGSSVDVQVSNDEEIPADASAVFANVEVRSNEKGGGMKIVPTGQSSSGAPITIKYQDSGPTSTGLMLKLSSDGKATVSNLTGTYGGDVDFKIDIQGYFSGHSDEGGSYTPLTATTVYSSTATGNTALAAGETRTIPVAGLAGIPGDGSAGAAALSLTVRNWTASGTLTAYSADDEEPPETTNLSFTANKGEPENGSTTTAIVQLVDDGAIKLRNSSNGSLTVYVSAQGWFSFALSDVTEAEENAASPETPPEIGPNPDLQVIESAESGAPVERTFPLPVEGSFTLALESDGTVSLNRDGSTLGTYQANAFDDVGTDVPTELNVSGNQLVQTVSPPSGTEFPVVAAPTFTASSPTSTEVGELYPDAEELLVDDEPAEVTQADSVEVIDGAMDEFFEDVQDPDDQATAAAAETGEVSIASSLPYIKVPKKSGVKQKYYYWDPLLIYPQHRPWKKAWHDYCTKSPNGYGQASFRGPCARHDLCIEFKQATHRNYCDSHLKATMRVNCRYAYDRWYEKASKFVCYRHATVFYAAVHRQTGKYHDAGQWGHNGKSWYPRYRWDRW